MCIVSEHAINRAKERWKVSAQTARQSIEESFMRSVIVGEWIEPTKSEAQQLRVDTASRRVMVVVPDKNVVITVYEGLPTVLDHEVYEAVIQVHRDKIEQIEREKQESEQIATVKRSQLLAEQKKLTGQIKRAEERLATMRQRDAEISSELSQMESELTQFEYRKKNVIKSLAFVV